MKKHYQRPEILEIFAGNNDVLNASAITPQYFRDNYDDDWRNKV